MSLCYSKVMGKELFGLLFDFLRRALGRKAEYVDDGPPEKLEFDDDYSDTLVPVRRKLDTGMPLEVLGADSKVLFNARIVTGNEIRLTLGRLPGELSFKIVPVGEPITLLAYDTSEEHVRVNGTVIESSVTKLVIKDWSIVDRVSKRDSARLPLAVPAQLYALTDKYRAHPKECTLVDLSLTGARISSTEELNVGDEYNLSFEVIKDDGKNTCHVQVVWATSADGTLYEYGLLFAQLQGYRHHNLELSLQALKENIVKKTKA